MKRIHSAADPILIGHMKSVLEAEDIPCVVRNEFLGGGTGEIPAHEIWPELWVIDDFDATRAHDLVDWILSTPQTDNQTWRCSQCGEESEAQFSACWNCGVGR